MQTILKVHFRNSFHEYFLPGIDNRRLDVTVPANIADASEDLHLTLEVWNDTWFICDNPNIVLHHNGKQISRIALESELLIEGLYTPEGIEFTLLISENYSGYTTFQKYKLPEYPVTFGKGSGNRIEYKEKFVSEQHGSIEPRGNDWFAVDNNSKNGTYINGRRLSGGVKLKYGDELYLFGLKIVYLGDFIALNSPEDSLKTNGLIKYDPQYAVSSVSDDNDRYYIRSPRRIIALDDEPIEIDAPPTPQNSNRQPLLFTIGPAFTMVLPMTAGVLFTMWSAQNSGSVASPFIFMGIITSASAAAIGVLWAILNYRYSKKREVEQEVKRLALYKEYLIRMKEKIEEKYDNNTAILNERYPSTIDCVKWGFNRNRRIWERSFIHEDFLTVRLGCGDLPSPCETVIPKDKFTMLDDAISEEPARIKNRYRVLKNVPVGISLLENHCVGIISDQNEQESLARTMILNLTANHSYTEVKTVFIYRENHEAMWKFVRYLPHTWDSGIRLVANDKASVGEVLYHLSSVFRMRSEEERQSSSMQKTLPHYVVFIEDMELLENEAALKYLLNSEPGLGVSTVILGESIDMMPNTCTAIIQKSKDFMGFYSLNGNFADSVGVEYDEVNLEVADNFSRAISSITVRDVVGVGEVPTFLSFLDLYGVTTLEELDVYKRWLENRTFESMKSLVGQRGGSESVHIDIHEKHHGPHGLVAGTTGSGKSEMLQTYILSLALNYHPTEIAFIIIDYKGGGMAESFMGLPHLAGIITNLGGNQTQRALISIKSEIKRRETVFQQAGVKHIDAYIERYRAGHVTRPMPHMIIIADEFAELKKEQGDFVRELVSASRVGRSLGVHLILATQKPTGVVDDEIWGNSRFRVCLRVQDKQDSNEMIKRPDAAYITNVGRSFFQVGNDELFEEFQSGWSGAQYEPETIDEHEEEVSMINLWGKPHIMQSTVLRHASKQTINSTTQLRAAVEFIGQIARENAIENVELVWFEPLNEVIYLDECSTPPSDEQMQLTFALGMADDPVNQRQIPILIDIITANHIFISGSVGSGKTTLLQTMIYSLVSLHSPNKLNMYIVDYGSKTMGVFSPLPHIGGIVFDNEPDKADKLIALLFKELDERKNLFSQRGFSSYSDYTKEHSDIPATLLIIDNFAAYIESCPDHEERLVILTREAASYGIYVIIATTGDIRAKLRQNISTAFGLQLQDKFEYGEVLGERTELIPAEGIPGRGLLKYPRPLEFQTALCVRPQEGVTLNEILRKDIAQMWSDWNGNTATQIPQIPEDMSYESFEHYKEIEATRSMRVRPIGYDIDAAEPFKLEMDSIYCYSISGRSRSGKTNLLKVLMLESIKAGDEVVLINSPANKINLSVGDIPIITINSADELFDYLEGQLIPEFRKRNSSFTEGENMDNHKQLSIFIADVGSLCSMVYNYERDMHGFLELALVKGIGHRINWFGAIDQASFSEQSASTMMRTFTNYKTGIHFGGQVDEQRIFSFDLPYNERTKRTPPGLGYVETSTGTIKVVTPLVK